MLTQQTKFTNIDLNNYIVHYKGRHLKALSLLQIEYSSNVNFTDDDLENYDDIPKFIEIAVINERNRIEVIRDICRNFRFYSKEKIITDCF